MSHRAPPKTPLKTRNTLHLAMLQSKRGGVHDKSHKRRRGNARAALARSLKEGGFAQTSSLLH